MGIVVPRHHGAFSFCQQEIESNPGGNRVKINNQYPQKMEEG